MPDANALDVADRVMAKMDELKQSFPEGLDYEVGFDTTPYTRESIHEVFKTLRDAIILVAIVVLLFLQNWRSAIIPLVAVPVAIIGTFAVMAVFGFSLNNLTLFGLVLAIGIVVDDAIVVVEAVEHHIETRPGAARGDDQGDGPGLRPGDRRRPGAERRVRAVRVHQRHHGAVLPAVRADHRRLHDHLGVQLADAEPGADGGACSRPHGQADRLPPLPRLVRRRWLGWVTRATCRLAATLAIASRNWPRRRRHGCRTCRCARRGRAGRLAGQPARAMSSCAASSARSTPAFAG